MENDISHNFEMVYSYIRLVARQMVPHFIGPLDYEDVAHEAFIKLLHAYQKQYITFPEAYIRRIVHNLKVDLLRKYRPGQYVSYTQFLDNEDEEGSFEYWYVSEEAEHANPEYAFLDKEAVEERITSLIAGLAKLHARQKHAAIATLRQRGGDIEELLQVVRMFARDDELCWPTDKHEKQTLQASFGPARKNLARTMEVPLTPFK